MINIAETLKLSHVHYWANILKYIEIPIPYPWVCHLFQEFYFKTTLPWVGYIG